MDFIRDYRGNPRGGTTTQILYGLLGALFGASLILAVLAMPIAMLWALNTLFPLEIPYTVPTYCAAAVLLLQFGSTHAVVKKSK